MRENQPNYFDPFSSIYPGKSTNKIVAVFYVLQYSLPDCYILRIFVQMFQKIRLKTTKYGNIPAMLHLFCYF